MTFLRFHLIFLQKMNVMNMRYFQITFYLSHCWNVFPYSSKMHC